MARPTVLGYCWPQSAAAGDEVALHLSATTGTVRVEVARIGATRQVVLTLDDLEAGDHEVPADASAQGCGWPAASSITVDAGWASGYYEVLLTGAGPDGEAVEDRAFVVVRPPTDSDRRILLALGTNTWHAYNDFAGSNIYNGGTQSSLLRPMARGLLHKPPGVGRRVAAVNPPDPEIAEHIGYLLTNEICTWAGSAGWPNWEEPFVAWAEAAGYAFDVVTNVDLEDPATVAGYELLLSVGHDEYWSGPMRDTVEGFIAAGGNVAFLTGNTSFWQVRLEDDGTTMVGYKQRFADDPVFGTDRQDELTTIWSDHLLGRPENAMTGVSFVRGGYARIGRRVPNGAGGYTVHRPDHWLFEGTGLEYGDLLGAAATVVGYECDGCDFTYRDGLPYPTGTDGTPEGFEILGTAPAASFTHDTAPRPPAPGERDELGFNAWRLLDDDSDVGRARLANGHAVLGTYTSPAGGVVVTTGCTDWAMGLAEHDAQVEQVTRNLLDRLG